jgi:chaperone required for assembly of F1-ATPase
MKRFYKNATVDELDTVDGGFVVLLDGRSIKTPGKNNLVLPTRAAAEAVAKEWQDQGEKVDPASMPMMRFGATAIDRVETQCDVVVDEISAYGAHDLLCYRGDDPELAAMQAKAWQPLLDWADETLGAKLVVTEGISSVDQEPASLAALRNCVAGCTNMQLSALHTMVSISGSLILSLALIYGETDAETAWQAASVDERFQEALWGTDAEASERLEARKQALADADSFYACCAVTDKA